MIIHSPTCFVPKYQPARCGGVSLAGFESADGRASMSNMLFAGDWASIRIHADAASRDPVDVYGPELLNRIRRADVAVVNLETAIGGSEPISKDGPNLQGPRESASALRRAGFHLATLANNHTYDYGEEGLVETLDSCRDAGLAVCGAGRNLEEAVRPHVMEHAGQRIGILNFCDLEEGAADWESVGTASIHHPHMRDFVREARDQVDVLVLVVHGGREYVPMPPPYWREVVLAAGREADLVVGHHPHISQGATLIERDDGTRVPVLFSTGNFLFRPAAPAPGWIPPCTAEGFLVEAGFSNGALSRLELIPYRIEGERGPRIRQDLEAFCTTMDALSAPLADSGQVSDWFDALTDHCWEIEVRERVRGLTEKACADDLGAMKHALSHHRSPAHITLIHRAMERKLLGEFGCAPQPVREALAGWFSGDWPRL